MRVVTTELLMRIHSARTTSTSSMECRRRKRMWIVNLAATSAMQRPVRDQMTVWDIYEHVCKFMSCPDVLTSRASYGILLNLGW